jgi:hypothetical protein
LDRTGAFTSTQRWFFFAKSSIFTQLNGRPHYLQIGAPIHCNFRRNSYLRLPNLLRNLLREGTNCNDGSSCLSSWGTYSHKKAAETKASTDSNSNKQSSRSLTERTTSTMPRHRVAKHYINLPPPPHTPNWCAYEAGMITQHLVRKHNAHKWQVHYLLGMLHESYLLSLPRLKTDSSPLCDSSPTCLRWLWVAWAAKILRWPELRPEGDPEGFSAEVYSALREKVFPFPKVERDDAGRLLHCAPAVPYDCTCTRPDHTTVSEAL